MANCSNCGAPLPLKSTICTYCRSLNDVDIRRELIVVSSNQQLNRTCPRCKCTLITIALSGKESILIERCEQCFGLFFDIGELEQYLNSTDVKSFEINHHCLNILINENSHKDYPTVYIKCPVCANLMNRINYGKKSGVVVNKCSQHGIWLDSGCLNHIVNWAKAGGFELDKISKEENQRKETLSQKRLADNYKSYYTRDLSVDSNTGIIDLVKLIKTFFS